ncbi:hypothetical protein JG688_00016393 [Phytophthora aleatoria]|uniref:PiggyBac transposable element-derived protein domain-containing protein n=1 Tax=Phytophthora aleatoria TaxID=2496075 RepID=A0A8J5MCH0_9STRA|nr:hypothetical protein JG688_00016393 [Phytophthora aleatoria]
MRLEVYCGKAQQVNSQQSVDPNSGPAAVVRNLEACSLHPQDDVYHLVVTDRFYTSVQLVFQLLHRKVYSVGTIMGDRVGYPQHVVEKNHDRTQTCTSRDYTHDSGKTICPQMTAVVWWDRKPVQFLGTGSSRGMETCRTYLQM